MSGQLVKLVTTAPHKYAGRWYVIGDALSVSETEAADLIALRFAVRAPVDDAAKAVIANKAIAAAIPRPAPDLAWHKRRYKRRDLEPE